MNQKTDLVAATDSRWQFWIDVGGTFTDCCAKCADGKTLRHKLLSSAVTKGTVCTESDGQQIVDPARTEDPDNFWCGYQCHLFDRHGNLIDKNRIAAFDPANGTLTLETPQPDGSSPASYELFSDEEAPIVAIRYLLQLQLTDPIPAVSVRLGTTRGTNALITRSGAKTALLITRGFGDALEIGYQDRPHLFQLAIKKMAPLYQTVVEIDERITTDGQVLISLDRDFVRKELSHLHDAGFDSVAICLLHGFAHPIHELQIEQIARDLGFQNVSVSSRVAPLIKLVARGDTTVVDAYLNPVLDEYLRKLCDKLPGSDLRILTSAGGLVNAKHFFGKDSILSGPAGGVVGFTHAARAVGHDRAIGFDMGGTSTDVSRFDGQFQLEYETKKAGVRMVTPMMAIETIAAGGGSICSFDGVKLVVGPSSAGADPGPACYGRGGPLTVTDVNLLLGKILPEFFPFPLDRQAAETQAELLIDEIDRANGQRYGIHELASGFSRIAVANMAAAIHSISVSAGADPREYLLVAFGGAAAQHACAVARELGIRKILNHPDAGILSARGIGQADVVRHAATGIYRLFDSEIAPTLDETFGRLTDNLFNQVRSEGIAADRIEVRRSLDLRYMGLDAYLTITEPSDGEFKTAFDRAHRDRYGYILDRELEVVAARVEVTGRSDECSLPSHSTDANVPTTQLTTEVYFGAIAHDTPVFKRSALRAGDRIQGPAVVVEYASTTVIDPGWSAEVLTGGELLLSDTTTSTREVVSTKNDPIMLEVFNNRFTAIAEQMGITLRNTSISVNVKERLDFSCAIFTPAGDLVVNAPHIPVHLGAMSQSVRSILEDNRRMRPGDVFVTNDPYRGGSHLPDVTVVTPVHDPQTEELLFFTASRAHHAEIGGIRPGSMPPFSRNLGEEGVLIRNFHLIEQGKSQEEHLREVLLSGDSPSRNVDDNLADIAAQAAANRQGAIELQQLIQHYSFPVVEAYMHHVQAAAEHKMRVALSSIENGEYRYTDYLDLDGDKAAIRVCVTIEGDSAEIDFSGTSPVLPSNLNANPAIVTAAVMYCLRCLIDEDIPLNEGVLGPIQILLPECLLNPPQNESAKDCAAVAGGNVETSQRVVDVLLGALGAAAGSQGTMNNLLFGDETFGYYETIAGGSGATPNAPGADAVHTHMTNTRITDPEVLEKRYPVRLHEFSIRKDSGGPGMFCGGNGTVRRIEFLKNLEVSILSQRRGAHPPYGLSGGEPGAIGRNTLKRACGSVESLPALVEFSVEPGDTLSIETPGGGGFSKPP